MNKFKIFSITFLAASALCKAQDINQAKVAIDAEQFEKAKGMLKGIVNKGNGKAAFLLGNVYLKQNIEDSAKVFFQKGLTLAEGGKFNNIGLGQLDLDRGDVAAAKAKFDLVTKDVKKKEVEEYIYIAKAYTNSDKPNYQSAIDVLKKAALINSSDAQVQLALGDAYYGNKNQNEAYSAYRNAYATDSSLLRAKMQLGVLLKGAKAFDKAVESFNEVVGLNANYGPVYRELAETYYLWGTNSSKLYTENIQKALGFYEKYLSLTDYSLASRMRHADFLILAKDYKALEVEANKMKEIGGVNPRILRYLGYSAFQNGNVDSAIKALTEFTTKGTNKLIAKDFLFLAQAKLQKSISADGKTIDQSLFSNSIADFNKAIEMDSTVANDLNAIGKDLFTKKFYNETAKIFETAIANKESKNFLEDNVYFGSAVIAANRGKDLKTLDKVSMEKADKAMDDVIAASPNYAEVYLYKGRINSSLENDAVAATAFAKYAEIVTAKGEADIAKNKAKLTESYNNLGAFYANSDVVKAKEFFNKTLALDSTNEYAANSLKILGKK